MGSLVRETLFGDIFALKPFLCSPVKEITWLGRDFFIQTVQKSIWDVILGSSLVVKK